jgi:hypothetical protein
MKYSLNEIEYMRELVHLTTRYGPTNIWFQYNEVKSENVEMRLRTYMQNGTKPKELRRALKRRIKIARKKYEGDKKVQEYIGDAEYELREADAIYSD